MSVPDNKELVRMFIDRVAIHHDADSAAELITADYMVHDPTRPDFRGGIEAFKEMMRECVGSTRDDSFTVDDMIAEGEEWSRGGQRQAARSKICPVSRTGENATKSAGYPSPESPTERLQRNG